MNESTLLWYLKLLLSSRIYFAHASDTEGMAVIHAAFYCIQKMNGGRIENAMDLFQDKRSAKSNGFKSQHIKALKVNNVPGLWHWEDSTLVIDIYPQKEEELQRAKQRGGNASAEARKAMKEQKEYKPKVDINNY